MLIVSEKFMMIFLQYYEDIENKIKISVEDAQLLINKIGTKGHYPFKSAVLHALRLISEPQ